MSIASVLEARSTTGTIFLTPTKKRKLSLGSKPTLPSTAELYKWVFTSSAVAPCFICDIRVMKRHKEKGEEFWWLKRQPCRTVKIVGLVVGIQTYEKRICYIVDDGTSVIECMHKCGAPPPSPSKEGKKKSILINDTALPKPIAWVGITVEIMGRIYEFNVKESTEVDDKGTKEARRQIQVQEIVRCQSMNDQLRHWQTVLDLHKSNYSLAEPFIIPGPLSVSTPSQHSKISTPSSIASTVTSTTTSDTSASISSSPIKSDTYQSPRKLRHPSRLHTADLIGNTFRIYIKHYMDNPPALEDSEIETDLSDDDDASIAEPSTPTKRLLQNDQTPRLSCRPSYAVDETPRPSRTLISSTSHSRKGFTLSYLRRVPELSELARRVVQAEVKRRDRQARKKAKEAVTTQTRGSRSQGPKTRVPEVTISSTNLSEDSLSSRTKRLWKWAIIQLIEEGSIVLWDGPKYTISSNLFSYSMNSRLWKFSSSNNVNTTVTSDASVFSSSLSQDNKEYFDLSDPNPDEEAYVALTAELLAEEIERVIQVWVKSRQRSEPAKFTKEGILQRLHRDDRWRKVGEWHVEEAIDLLGSRGIMYPISKNVWRYSSGFSQRSRIQS
ncbi:hypothetical protein F5890DRAFT_1528178 [Lentinula detonsa]|uniref:CST complex subunit STN1 n=1 Tax=Lentinula detonsa TaxID=2804962 RepID=A0AA38PVT6_9AGAR|nr:hypothetical protein F5890DRAFT_1528178 [Lentinula detonsa]